MDEKALEFCIFNNHLAGAALDVFEEEPYQGPLVEYENVMLTAHIGASSKLARFNMEYQAAEDCIRVLKGQEALRLVKEKEID